MTGRGRAIAIGLPLGWLLVFFALPLLNVLAISLTEAAPGVPPFRPIAGPGDVTAANYITVAGDPHYAAAYLGALAIAATTTAICLVVGYPMAWAIARAPAPARPLLIVLVMLPFWTSFLVRVYAWMGLLNANGLVNRALIALGVTEAPLALLDGPFAVQLGMVYAYLPFMVLPLYAVLERIDPALLDAAADLGARPFSRFLTVILPLSWTGAVAGALLVFVPAIGEFVIPDLLGGGNVLMIGHVLWAEFFHNRDWPLAAAIAIAVLLVVAVPVALVEGLSARGPARTSR
ncbi:MAG: ABC transporter permease subunit [Alphaproteobacteria bacterium]|nr:ABC transporter permease subunit [Alphaproteobacteria bacterium]